MGAIKIKESMFPKLAEMYNEKGKAAVYQYIRSEFGISRPDFVMKRIKNSEMCKYDFEADRFVTTSNNHAVEDADYTVPDSIVAADETGSCKKGAGHCPDTAVAGNESKDGQEDTDKRSDIILRNEISTQNDVMEKLVNELIKDRLLALSRYVTMDSQRRTLLINQTALTADGFKIISH